MPGRRKCTLIIHHVITFQQFLSVSLSWKSPPLAYRNYQAQTQMCWGSSCSLKLNLNKLCNSQKFLSNFFCLSQWNIEKLFSSYCCCCSISVPHSLSQSENLFIFYSTLCIYIHFSCVFRWEKSMRLYFLCCAIMFVQK